jgi:hypothetical protein
MVKPPILAALGCGREGERQMQTVRSVRRSIVETIAGGTTVAGFRDAG